MAASDAFYNEIRNEVIALIKELGTSYTIEAPSTYDSLTMTTTPGAQRQVDGVVSTQSQFDSVAAIAFAVTETSSVWLGKKSLLLSPEALPLADEKIIIGGDYFSLGKLVEIKPADVTLLYILDISK